MPVPLDWRAKPAETATFAAGLGMEFVLGEPGAGAGLALDEAWHRAVAGSAPAGPPTTTWHAPFVISATSGSTAAPKAIVMTHAQYYFAIAGMFELMGLHGRHRFLSTMPLFYSGGRNSALASYLLTGIANSGPLLTDASGQRCITLL